MPVYLSTICALMHIKLSSILICAHVSVCMCLPLFQNAFYWLLFENLSSSLSLSIHRVFSSTHFRNAAVNTEIKVLNCNERINSKQIWCIEITQNTCFVNESGCIDSGHFSVSAKVEMCISSMCQLCRATEGNKIMADTAHWHFVEKNATFIRLVFCQTTAQLL